MEGVGSQREARIERMDGVVKRMSARASRQTIDSRNTFMSRVHAALGSDEIEFVRQTCAAMHHGVAGGDGGEDASDISDDGADDDLEPRRHHHSHFVSFADVEDRARRLADVAKAVRRNEDELDGEEKASVTVLRQNLLGPLELAAFDGAAAGGSASHAVPSLTPPALDGWLTALDRDIELLQTKFKHLSADRDAKRKVSDFVFLDGGGVGWRR